MQRRTLVWPMSSRTVARSHSRTLLLLVLLCVCASVRLSAQSLQRRLDRRLDAMPWARNSWGIAVIDDRGRTVYARNADRLFVPASNTKIVVSAVGSALLAPDFTVKTSVYGTGPASTTASAAVARLKPQALSDLSLGFMKRAE